MRRPPSWSRRLPTPPRSKPGSRDANAVNRSAWITGTTTFCGHSLHVDPGVYVPRVQSEELARRSAAILAAGGSHAADLCSGAGAVAVHLMAEAPAATVVGVDLDPRAAACARRNGVRAIVGDLDGPLRSHVFDVVTAVAPYVPTDELRLLPADVRRYEPRIALDGGEDGLDVVRRVVAAGARLLRGGGWLAARDRRRPGSGAHTDAGRQRFRLGRRLVRRGRRSPRDRRAGGRLATRRPAARGARPAPAPCAAGPPGTRPCSGRSRPRSRPG